DRAGLLRPRARTGGHERPGRARRHLALHLRGRGARAARAMVVRRDPRTTRDPPRDRRALRRGLRAARRRTAPALTGTPHVRSLNRIVALIAGGVLLALGIAGLVVTAGIGFIQVPGVLLLGALDT